MSRSQRFLRATALAMAVALFAASLPFGAARAGLVTTERVVAGEVAAGERERMMALFERDDVRAQMEALGVDRAEVVARLASLSDAEVREIAGRLDELPAGQSVIEGILVVAGLVLIGLIITDLFGITDVFAFIRPALAD
ncbi:MAG TPA: PA2779 family protein [Geminicoccaceae bacterium]|nr:PA2779 family protein [Geminicoccaceae bacterium]